MNWEQVYGDLRKRNWIILLVLSSASFLFLNDRVTLGIILGGFIIIANFKIFQHTLRKAFSPKGEMRTGKAAIIAKYYFRLLGLGIILYFLITKGWVDPVGLTAGLSTVVISIVSYGLHRAWKTFAKGAA